MPIVNDSAKITDEITGSGLSSGLLPAQAVTQLVAQSVSHS